MRTTIFAVATSIVAAVMPAHAEEHTVLPEITVIGAPPKNTAPPDTSHPGAGPASAGPTNSGHTRCGTATTGGDQSFGCLNETLKKHVDQINPVLNAPPHSVIPYRPPSPVFTSPLGRR
jgi:hypothetical protein